MPPSELLWLITSALLATCAFGCALVAWRREGTANIIHATPTFTAREVVEQHRFATIGATGFGEPIELYGTLEADEALFAPYSSTPCVAYDFTINEEHVQRDGDMRYGRTQEIGGFDTHQRRVQRCYIADATGRTAVDLAEAQIELLETVARYERFTGLSGEEREIWREEWALPLGRMVYVLGYLTTADNAPLIARHPIEPDRPFLISHRDEQAVLGRTRTRAYLLYLLSGLSGGAAVVGLLFGLGVI